jgi:hypothetical protein
MSFWAAQRGMPDDTARLRPTLDTSRFRRRVRSMRRVCVGVRRGVGHPEFRLLLTGRGLGRWLVV